MKISDFAAIRNRYEGSCCYCRRFVPANAGFTIPPSIAGGRWKVRCNTCEIQPEPEPYIPSHYRTLGLKPPTSRDQIKRAYRTLSLKLHPDQGGSDEEFVKLHSAYETALRECRS